ncbi:hypothetical protein CL176_01960 [Suicoccus acidiformans]|uniref:Hydrolase n=1 Tax=Suicoccus acidiformans TaxID=2036206 RepID=A0A347WIH6_9LACT|nr:HAD-IA family hydrolase [Suicoccus acidiformans]AXY24883.1 hypothetical protein CL176_01960 [Suicoccus acidiformans]
MGDIKNIIFDLDSTLIDSDSIYFKGWLHAFKSKGIKIDENIIHSLVGLSIPDSTRIISDYVESYDLALELRSLREDYFYSCLEEDKLKMMPYAMELLVFFYENDFNISLATSTHADKGERILDTLQLQKFFVAKTYGDQVKNPKPHPEIYLTSLDKLDAKAENSVVIEDSLTGCTAAIKAQIPTYLVPYSEKIEVISPLVNIVSSLKDVYTHFKDIHQP